MDTQKKEESWAFVFDALDKMQHQNDRLDAATGGLMIAPESPLLDTQWRTVGVLVDALSMLVDDQSDFISWFVYECDYGRDPKEAGFDENIQLINSHEQLRWLIDSLLDDS